MKDWISQFNGGKIMLCKLCGEEMEVRPDVNGDIWISCPKTDESPEGAAHEVYLITRGEDGKVVLF